MPIQGVIDLQRRSLPLGEIRIGESEPIPGKQGRKPVRRETFRFTTPVEETAAAIAERFGGTPVPWDRRRGYWVVDTDQAVIEVWVPPRGKAVDAYMEMWDGGKCLRRCDGITEIRSGRPCMCPQPEDRTDPALVAAAANERKRLAALRPPQACKPLTRINVQIPGLPGVTGVWQLSTGSANAAVETADSGEVLDRARERDVYLPALLLIHWRPGQDGHPYPVPVLRLRPSAEQLAELPSGLDGMLAQLHGGDGSPLAIETGQAAPAPAPEPPAPAQPAQDPPAAKQGKRRQRPTTPAAPAQPSGGKVPATAQDVADAARDARTRAELRPLFPLTRDNDWAADLVCIDEAGDVYDELGKFLDERWGVLPDDQAAGASPAGGQQDQDGSLFGDDPGWEDR